MKRMIIRRFIGTVATGAVVLAAAACGGGGETDSKDDGTVRLGFLPFAGAAAWQIADDKGYFEEVGLKLERVDLRTPADLVPNLLNGTVNFGGLNPGNLSQALAQGLDLKIIGVTYYTNKDMSIMSLKSSGITEPKDLEGKKVGLVQLQNTNQAALLETLTDAGADIDKIEFVLIPATDMPAALRSGQVDAGHVLYPLAATMGDEIQVVVEDMMVPYGEQAVQAYTVVGGKWASENPETVTKLQEVLENGNETAASDKEALVNAIVEITGAKTGLVKASELPAFGNELKLESSQAQLDLMTKYGFLDDPIDFSEYVYQN